MRWRKYDLWKAGVVAIGVLFLVLMVLVMVSVADAHGGVSAAGTVTVQATPTVDLTVTALAKEQLILQNRQLQQSEDRGFSAWLWSNAAAIVASFLSTLVIVIGALIGFRQWRTNRNDTLTKEANDRKEAQDKELRDRAEQRQKDIFAQDKELKDRQAAQDKELRAQAEERFKSAITALGDKNEATQVGGAILLQSFLNPEDREIYGRYYSQIFNLAVAYLRFPRTSQAPQDVDTPLPLTSLRQVLVVVFKEAFPLARSQNRGSIQSLDATGIQLDNGNLREADLQHAWMRRASIRDADLIDATLISARLFEADLRQAWLWRADLRETDLRGADLRETNLRETDFRGANLREVDLRGADLKGSNLSKADLREANLDWKSFEEVFSLEDANLLSVKGLTKEQLEACKAKGAIIDGDATTNPSPPPVSPAPPSQQSS